MTTATRPTYTAAELRAAYDKGWRSQGTSVDWDDALDRFTNRNCKPHSSGYFCDLEDAWADGWSDRSASHTKGHALRCDAPDHETCETGS